MIFKLLSKIKR